MAAARAIEREIRISIGHRRIVSAFFDAGDLRNWWGVRDAVTEPREGGLYLIGWPAGAGWLQGIPGGCILAGVLRSYHITEGFTVGSSYWLPSPGGPLGPMELAVRVQGKINQSIVRVRQSGFRKGGPWDPLFRLASEGWTSWLSQLRRYLDADPEETPGTSG